MKWTPASRMLDHESSRTIPPSILDSSARRAGVNMAPFKAKPPELAAIHLSAVAQHDQASLALLDDPLEGSTHWCSRSQAFQCLDYRGSTHRCHSS